MIGYRDSSFGCTPEQLLAIEALVNGKSKAQAAQAAGVHRTTLYRWERGDEAFRATYEQARRRQLEGEYRKRAAPRRIPCAADDETTAVPAADVLTELIACGTPRYGSRLGHCSVNRAPAAKTS